MKHTVSSIRLNALLFLPILATSAIATADDKAPSQVKDIARYDQLCRHEANEVLVNTRTMNVATHVLDETDRYNFLETLLIDPIDHCEGCFNITLRSGEEPLYIYEARLTKSEQVYSIAMSALYADGSKLEVLPNTICTANPAFIGFDEAALQ